MMSVYMKRLRHARPQHPPIEHRVTMGLFKFTAIALAAALAACAVPAPRRGAAQAPGSPLLCRKIGPALDCSDYDNIFTTPDAVKLPLSSCRRTGSRAWGADTGDPLLGSSLVGGRLASIEGIFPRDAGYCTMRVQGGAAAG